MFLTSLPSCNDLHSSKLANFYHGRENRVEPWGTPVKKTLCVVTASSEGLQEFSSSDGFSRRDIDGMKAHGGHAGVQYCRLFDFVCYSPS